MMKYWLFPLGLIALFACGDGGSSGRSKGAFTTSDGCKDCHSSGSEVLKDAEGRKIGPYDLWRSSMMANAARDPIWRAVVSAELAATPAATGAIEKKCLSCHGPAGYREGMLTIAGLSEDGAANDLARDGVTCTVCHQIEPDNLGTDESFSAGWTVGDNKIIYGPHAQPFSKPMKNRTGYTPSQGDHITESALCGTCHALETHSLTAAGEPTGLTLVEQATFLEWRNSRYAQDGPSCQGCHVPTTDVDGNKIKTPIARKPNGGTFSQVKARAPVGRHTLVGANTLVPRIFSRFGHELNTTAPAAAFDATAEAARAMLRTAAELSIGEGTIEGEQRVVPITVLNRTGHKLPSGIPIRRVWLHVTAFDSNNNVVFDSGAWDEDGRLISLDGSVLPFEFRDGPVEPHYQIIANSEQVQIYAARMCDANDKPTWALLRGSSYCEDDRLLPEGWSAAHPDAERTKVVGVDDDPDFQAGSDITIYKVPVAATRLQVQLVHQVLSARFMDEIYRYNTPEIQALKTYLAQVRPVPELIVESSKSL